MTGGDWGNDRNCMTLPTIEFQRCSNPQQVISISVKDAYSSSYQWIYAYCYSDTQIYIRCERFFSVRIIF